MRLFLKIIGGLFLALVLAIAGLALSLKAKLPNAPIDVVASTTGQAADDESSILLFGATRNTGLIVAESLLLACWRVRRSEFVRRPRRDPVVVRLLHHRAWIPR